MNINGTDCPMLGRMTFEQIGEILRQASPNQDGLGLVVTLTSEEQDVFVSAVGMRVGYAIVDLIADAVNAAGKGPCKVGYTYSNQVFRT